MDAFVAISNILEGSNKAFILLYGFAVLNFILSFILLFFGKRLLRISLGIIGFISFGSIPFWICMDNLYQNISPAVVLVVMGVIGVVAAFIVSYFTKLGIYITGAISGAQLGCLLYEMFYHNRYEQSIILIITLAIIFGLAGLILTYYFMSDMVIEITVFNGFLVFRSAIQYVVVAVTIGYFRYPNPFDSYKSYWVIFSGPLLFSFLGIFWQYYKYKNYPYLKNMESKQTTDEKC